MDFIDFHAHVIPKADHGSSSIDVSIHQLKFAKQYGINKIIATPHFYPHKENVDRFILRRNACYARLMTNMTDDLPEIVLGAEVLICDNIEEMPMLKSLCIEGTKVLLIELPFTDFSDSYVYSVKSMIRNGYSVIIAHADRYNPHDIDRMIAAGATIQLNAESISHLFVPRYIKKWLKNKCVSAIGSDIHGADKKSYVRFRRAVHKLGDHAKYIMSYSESLLSHSKK